MRGVSGKGGAERLIQRKMESTRWFGIKGVAER